MASVFKFLLALQLLLARPTSIKWMLLATRNFHSPLASWRAVVSHTTISLVNGTVRHSTRRGTKACRSVIRRIKTVTGTHNHSAHYSQNCVNFSNLINVSCQSKDDLGSVIPSKITSFRANQRSYNVWSINPYNLIPIPLSSEHREICMAGYFRRCKIWRFWVKKVYEKCWRF